LADLESVLAGLRHEALGPQPSYTRDVEPGAGGSIEFGRVYPPDPAVGTVYGDEREIQMKLYVASGTWDGTMVPIDEDADPIPVRCWPGGVRAKHYQQCVSREIYMPVVTAADGNRYVMLHFPIQVLYLREGIPYREPMSPYPPNHPD